MGFLDPVYFSVGVRWLTWVVALGILLLEAAPPHALEPMPALLAVTALQLSVMTLYLPVLRPRFAFELRRTGLARWLEDNPVLPALDIGFSCFVLFVSGGWHSPFHEYALTSVIAPSLKYGLRGANLAATFFTGLFLLAVVRAPGGVAGVYDPAGRLDGGFVAALVNPFMVAWFCALLAEVFARLRRQTERARALAAREERSRLAREIHDGVAQVMFMLTLSVEACRDLAARREQEDLREKLEGLLGLSRQALWEVRNAMLDLNPLLEGETTLAQAVERVMREFRTVSSMQGQVSCQGSEPALPAEARAALYRLIQECLANAFRHSGARRVDVRLQFEPHLVRVDVEDDGSGFDPARVKRGRGLDNMAARVEELGGRMTLSNAGPGARVTFEVPVEGRP